MLTSRPWPRARKYPPSHGNVRVWKCLCVEILVCGNVRLEKCPHSITSISTHGHFHTRTFPCEDVCEWNLTYPAYVRYRENATLKSQAWGSLTLAQLGDIVGRARARQCGGRLRLLPPEMNCMRSQSSASNLLRWLCAHWRVTSVLY